MSIIERPEKTAPQVPDELELIPTLPVKPVDRQAVLRRAADLVDEHGYLGGVLGCRGEGFCLLGAVAQAGIDMGYVGTPGTIPEDLPGNQGYTWTAELIGVEDDWAYEWSDDLGYSKGDDKARGVLSARLRELADGMPWPTETDEED